MKVKNDFVTNSSSTSWILCGEAKIILDGREVILTKQGQDATTLDMIKMLEGKLQYILKIQDPIDIIYSQGIDELIGDGWDDGDYTFAGDGYIFFGQSKIIEKVMNKTNIKLSYDGRQIEIPQKLIDECTEEYVKEKFKKKLKRLNYI